MGPTDGLGVAFTSYFFIFFPFNPQYPNSPNLLMEQCKNYMAYEDTIISPNVVCMQALDESLTAYALHYKRVP